jgi:carboxymethylenebutenolidase
MRDDDRLLDLPDAEFGSGVIGVCDVCGVRQAVVVLTKERFRLCVIDFLNKSWLKTDHKPTAPAPLYRTERVVFETSAFGAPREVPAIAVSPTKVVRRPGILVAPDTYGITTTVLDAALRFAHEGFEVLVPDVGKTDGIGAPHHAAMHLGVLAGGVPLRSAKVGQLTALYADGLRALAAREMVDPTRLGVFGSSFGGTLAVGVAAENTNVRAVATAYPMPFRPAEAIRLVTVPLLVVHGSKDRAARGTATAWKGALPATTVVEFDGARHHFLARDLRAYDLARAEEAWSVVVKFLKDQLFPPVPKPPAPPVKFAAPATPPTPAASVPKPAGA